MGLYARLARAANAFRAERGLSTLATPPAIGPHILAPPIPVRIRGQRMYKTAQVDRLTTDWPITLTSANAEILVSAIATRARMRQLERDDDYMRSMLWLLENNVVGWHGIKLGLKLKTAGGTYDHERIKAVRAAWHTYLGEKTCTVTRRLSGVEVQRLAIRALARDGGIAFRIYRGFDNDFNFAIEPIEIDRVDHLWSRPAGRENEIQFGVEMDKYHAPVAYHILTRHPGEVYAWRSGPKYRERVPADDVIGLWTIERAGQHVGMPLWPSIAHRLNHLAKYEESEAVAARVCAAKGGWFERTNTSGEYTGAEDDAGNKLSDTSPGQWEELPVGFKAVPNDPTHPTDAYAHFVKGQLRGASAGANLPYNSVANDLEGVNYSSIRAGLLEARDGFKYLQSLEAVKFMAHWFEAWLPYAIMAGKIPGVRLEQAPEILEAHRWHGRRWGWVDPLADIKADAMAVECGFSSRRRIIAESAEGGDIEEVFEELEEDQKLADKHGLIFAVQGKWTADDDAKAALKASAAAADGTPQEAQSAAPAAPPAAKPAPAA